MSQLRKIRLIGLGIALFLLFGAAGCSAKYEYAAESDQIWIYNSIDESSDPIDCTAYSTERADYFFETTLKDRQKDRFVDTAERILNDYPTDKVKFVVGTSFNTAYIGEVRNAKNTEKLKVNTIYFHIDDCSALNLLIELNAKHYGEKTPYGLLYAYSYGQCKDSGYDLPKALSDGKLKETVNKNKDITDLNTFIFLSSFTTDTEKPAAQTLSIKLYEKIGLQNLQDIIELNNGEEQKNIFDFYIKSVCYENGITPQMNIGLDEFYCYHTQKYVVAENISLNVRFFIAKDFEPTGNETRLSNYSDLKERLYESIMSFIKVNEFLENDEPLPTDYYMNNDITRGWADSTTYCVDLREFIYVTHEYCHIAMSETYRWGDGNWTLEAIASYCSTFLGEYETDFIINNCIEYLGKNDVADKAYDLLNRFPPKNRADFWDIFGYAEESIYPNYVMDDITWVLSQFIAPSFCNYLIETYGKDKFMQICTVKYSTEMSIYGKSFDQLRSDWFATLQAKYE